MDHSWRAPHLPPIPGSISNICPICSTSHFPFCPPPPFIENPRFHYSQSQNDYYHQRPRFDHPHPFPNHQSSLSYNYNHNYNPPIDGHAGRRPTWYGGNPSLDMRPYNAISAPPMVNGNHSSYHTGGVAAASYGQHDGYDNVGTKRMKIEPVSNNQGPRGSTTGGEISDASRFSSDNERILKLIHDHGNAANAAPSGLSKVGADLISESHGENANMYDMRFKRKREIQLPQPAESMQPNHNFLSSHLSTDINRAVYVNTPHAYHGQPPLPVSPPPPLPIEPPRNHFFEPLTSPPLQKPSLFPIDSSSSSRSTVPENQPSRHVYYANNTSHHVSSLSSSEEFYTRQSSSDKHVRDVQLFPLRHLSSEKPNIIDASQIFKQPHRASRPDHVVIILRGLPGSGKSYLAKVLRDIEVENGGEAPRIHSMDEYFMTEVEKAEDSELSKSSGSIRGKRQVMKTVMEYCYEPEMEEAYRASMLKAFKKTLDEGVYSFIIVDDRNLRVADFAQFWATAKRSGYEVYLVEASYTDPAGCAARNVHNFTLDDIQKMSTKWEEAPPLYLKMDLKSLLHGDSIDESGIQEVDMDMEDDDGVDASHESDIKSPQDNIKDEVDDDFTHHDIGTPDDVKKHHPEVKILSKSKWSNDLDGNESLEVEDGKKKDNALSGLIQSYSKEGKKSVRWGDQGGDVGFSISATRKATTRSLVIGPGAGYNMKSNPLAEDEYVKPTESKSQNVFRERMQAERESFKAVFDKRRQRIGGFNVDED